MGEALEGMGCGELLRSLGLFSPEKRRMVVDLMVASSSSLGAEGQL